MNISNIGQIFPPSGVQNGEDVSQKADFKANDSIDEPGSASKTVDMRNVSLNEVNQLIRSGTDELLQIVPFVPPHIINKYGPEYAAGVKVDFLGQVETSLEFHRSRGEETGILEKVLEKLIDIDGTVISTKVDVMA